ncbi:MAG: 2TM domain-containing protein [Chloroflexi bacterium]|nr:2TM domain-containing protein [Chloroflexota bacterium]
MNTEETKYQKARERVEALKGFYIHLTVYVVVNLILFSINMIVSPDRLWFFWPLMGWGVGLAIHALSVLGFSRAFGADWEERKIRELMEK